MSQAFLWALLLTLVLFLIAPFVGDAQVVGTPITPSGLHTQVSDAIVTGSGPTQTTQYDITGGTRPGDGTILFHSFGDFNVPTNNIANFLNNGSVDLNGNVFDNIATTNILARVTNRNPSSIFGTIQTNGVGGFDNANLFLMNPSGILFGPTASLNVGGSVSFTTAQYIRLFDSLNGVSANFYADPANDGLANSVFAMDPVVDFGFLSPAAYGFVTQPNPSATITVQGSALSVLPGQSISLVGGNISIQGGALPDGTVQPARLSAPNGRMQLASTASPGELDVNTLQSLPNVDGVSFTSFGSVSLAPRLSSLEPGSSIGSGTTVVFIKDGQLVLSVNDATLSTADVSSTPPDTDTIFLSPGSSIVTSNSGSGLGSDVQITAGNLNLDRSAITTENLGDGIGGHVTADVGRLSLANSASINSNNFGSGIGLGGNLTIQGRTGADSVADSVMLSNGSTITTQTVSLERGGDVERRAGGDVVIAARDVQLDASTINTGTFGPGSGGAVHITADSLTLENSSFITTETIALGEVGGDLFLNVGMLRLQGGSQIQSTNFTGTDLDGNGDIDVTGKGGNITIRGTTQGVKSAADSVVLSGSSGITSSALSLSGGGGGISIRATSLDLNEASVIKSSTSAFGIDLNGDGVVDVTGDGGDIVVNVQSLRVVDGSSITSSTASAEPLAGAGGTVTVEGLEGPGSQAGSVRLSGLGSGILSDSAAGLPGNVTVNAGTLTITNDAVIASGISLRGPAGNVGVTADSVVISAGGQIVSQSAALSAGQVTITANKLTLDKGSIVTSTISELGGRGGDVIVNAGIVSLANGARINSQSEAASNGRAGDITITGGSLMLANHAEITSSSKGTVVDAGDAGNVTITATGVFTSNASTIATSADNAKGGNIDITAHAVELSNGTLISANSRSPLLPDGEGNAGNVTVRSSSTFVMRNSSITTEASQASGGRIEITAPYMVRMINSKVETSVAGSDGDTTGGDITIDPIFVILQNSQFLARAFAGTGGNITITSNVFLADPSSVVSASSQLGISGKVDIRAPVQNISGELAPLSQEFSSAAALLAQRCAARAVDGKFSTFVVAGHEGLPAEPGGFLASPSLTAELLGSSLSGRDPHTHFSTVAGSFPEYDARPLQLAKLGNACQR